MKSHTSHRGEYSAIHNTMLTPTRPNRPKSSGTIARSSARTQVQPKEPAHSQDVNEVSSAASSSSSLSDMVQGPQSVDTVAPPVTSSEFDSQKTHETENVRQSSVSSTEDLEEGVAFRTHSADKLRTDDSDIDEYTITADQQKAMQELEKLKQDMDYVGEEDPPEYNVTELLKVLNKELAEDPMPEDDRARTIKFKDNLVDVVAPPLEYSDDEDFEVENSNANTGVKNKKDNDIEAKNVNISDKQTSENQDENSSSESNSKRDDSEKVLIEREGKFEFVHASDLEAMDLGLGFADIPSEEVPLQKSENKNVPSPPSKPRPNTANGTTRRPPHMPRLQRTQSASLPCDNDLPYDTTNYVSPYALSDEDKERKRKQDERRGKMMKEEKERQMYENMQKKYESDEAFQAWLYKKRQEAASRRQEAHKRESEGEVEARRKQEEDRQSAFAEWMKVKKEKQKEEQQHNRQNTTEMESCYYVRPREECERAYKMWLQKKNSEVRKARQQAKVQARYNRLLMRRARKAQTLAQASTRQEQTFHYVDVHVYGH